MAEAQVENATPETAPEVQLEGSTYEIIRNRLSGYGKELQQRLDHLNDARKEVFGSIDTALLGTERITTDNNCVPRDMVAVGSRFLFGYNVHFGLKKERHLSDVFAIYDFKDGVFHQHSLDLIGDERFQKDFQDVYRYYKNAVFAKFVIAGPHLYMNFRVGNSVHDIKTFKWLLHEGTLEYIDNRSDHEIRFPPQHEFEWKRTHRDLHQSGLHPHISIDDRVFVETVGGDLTIKIENNTESGEGIYSEKVENDDQTLDDAEIFYASVGNIVLLKIRPYQEDDFRYIVYNEKIQQARRLDAIEHACVLLPNDHGLIFSSGYYLQTGEHKTFESNLQDMLFEKRLAAPNGEDFLYVFYNRLEGVYILLEYNLISQQVETPLICHGFTLFEGGELICFKSQHDPQKHHAVQIWQTPFVGENYSPETNTDSLLYKIGNRDIVRGMAECHEVLTLIDKEESYANLYTDIVKESSDVIDSYFWVDKPETFNLKEVLVQIRDAATAAVDEFDKVVRVRQNTAQEIRRVGERTQEIITAIDHKRFDQIGDFVSSLADLRTVRGEIISLRELRYVDEAQVDQFETDVSEHSERLANRCVEFLLKPGSLAPYEKKVAHERAGIDGLTKVSDAKKVDEEIASSAAELEMLIEIVSNLKIDDATQRTTIIDSISEIFAHVNQARAALKKKIRELASVEGVAEFNSQMKLLNQGVVNYLDVCDTPQKCEEYLTKVMVQLEELEGRFAEFDEFIEQLSAKREEVYNAFETRKLQLVEARNKRANSLANAADRILKGIKNRVDALESINEINGYFASDLMIEKVRDIVEKLQELDDSVKVDDIQSRLKTVREDAVRQLKDRQELFVDGKNIIKLGSQQFTVNVQALDLTTVMRDGELTLHLTGTNFFETIEDDRLAATKSVWDQDAVSENREVYRAEYLAHRLLKSLGTGEEPTLEEVQGFEDDELVKHVARFMGPRYSEGYVKGVHDHDAAIILRPLVEMTATIGLLRYHTQSRALAHVYWQSFGDKKLKTLVAAKCAGFGSINDVFQQQGRVARPESSKGVGRRGRFVSQAAGEHDTRIRDRFRPPQAETGSAGQPQTTPFLTSGRATREGRQSAYVTELRDMLGEFVAETGLFAETLVDDGAEYLFAELSNGKTFVASKTATDLVREFDTQLKRGGSLQQFDSSIKAVHRDPASSYRLLRDWAGAFVAQRDNSDEMDYIDEMASLLQGKTNDRQIINATVSQNLTGLAGTHPQIDGDKYHLHYNRFMQRLDGFQNRVVPNFNDYVQLKKDILDSARDEMKLEEFRPRVLTSFVRNKLLDTVYLPLIGDNLAKQMGAAGEQKRTDRMGLLLLVSPPGYGKTTLMEYVANRLGIIFMKINGPAIGHDVTSLDPDAAPNAGAREEVEKLNLSLEMGDNVMIYLDDIQHCHPEFLQKFISLCDAQRKIEGVYKGRARTYDLRGRKVAVVMAGNPYTESGEKFQIPDMLANRADVYNLGEIIGDNADAFELSFLENSLTSNTVLAKLASRSQQDVYAVVKMAETGQQEGIDLEGNYSLEELNELVATMKKLMRVRDVILSVNREYIRSAAQADEYRTEPPFKLQGSYRNMNRIAEKVYPIMNDEELQTLIVSNYENDVQTLTSDAEANLLKFKELTGILTEEEAKRWDHIRKAFQRNNQLKGVNADDKVGQVILQLSSFSEGLDSIREAVTDGVTGLTQQKEDSSDLDEHAARLTANIGGLKESLEAIHGAMTDGVARLSQPDADSSSDKEHVAELIGHVQGLKEGLEAITQTIAGGMTQMAELGRTAPPADFPVPIEEAPATPPPSKKKGQTVTVGGPNGQTITVVNKIPRTMLNVLENQFNLMHGWMEPILATTLSQTEEIRKLQELLNECLEGYSRLLGGLSKARDKSEAQD